MERSFAGALVALLAMAVLAPSSARAGCSHYVRTQHAALGGVMGLELLGAPAERLPSERPRPCSGVFCTGNPGVPSVPSTTVVPQFDDWGMLAEPAPVPGAASFLRQHGDACLRPVHNGLGIFHPPRRADRV